MQIKNKETIILAQQRPLRNLTKGTNKDSGRNNHGKLTVRHQGGGVKQLYRHIDWFRQDKDSMVINFEYDPNRSARLAKLAYINNEKKKGEPYTFGYILAVKGMKVFDKLQTINERKRNIFLRPGDASILGNFETGDFLNSVEAVPGEGALFARSAGTFCQVIQSSTVQSSNYVKLRLPSGEQRLFSPMVKATLGVISNEEHGQRNLEKAGRNRWLNKRPSVRGVAMNPVDHPHGGGQGKTKGGRPSVTPKSWPTKGQPTRSPRKKNRLILSVRRQL